MKKSFVRYIEPKLDGKPSQTLAQLLDDVQDTVKVTLQYQPGVSPFKGQNHRKVQITVTVEAIKGD